MVVETAWLMSSAMLMPLERMRVGMSSDSASQTQTPGPTAKNAMKAKVQMAVSQPFCSDGTVLMSAFSIFSGAVGCGVQIGKRILEKRRDFVRRQAAVARRFPRAFCPRSSER